MGVQSLGESRKHMELAQWAGTGTTACPVNSHNEWDPLEEVIVGRLEGATVPPSEAVGHRFPPVKRMAHRLLGGRHYPRFLVDPAQRELDGFIHILEAEGVIVRRPNVVDIRSLPDAALAIDGASAPPARATASWSSATRSSRRRWHGARATSRVTPTGRCSRSTSRAARAGCRRRSRSCSTSCTRRADERTAEGRADPLHHQRVRARLRRRRFRPLRPRPLLSSAAT